MFGRRKEIVVIGAGFSGLVAAWRLQKDGYGVTVVEKSQDVGGLIQTESHHLGLIETAANGLLSSSLVEELFEDCKVEVLHPKKTARRRYLAIDGKLFRFPLSIIEALGTLWKIARYRKCPPLAGETLAAWAERAIGKPMADKIVALGVLGIYAADSRGLSANLIVGRFFDPARKRNIPGKIKGTVSAAEGLGQLLGRLRTTLISREVVFKFLSDGAKELAEARRKKVPVVIATSAWSAAEILGVQGGREPRVDPRILALAGVQSIALISATAFFRKAPPKLGYGALFAQRPPHGANDGILGCLQNSEIFEARAVGETPAHSETWILGGASRGAEMIDIDDGKLTEMILEKRDRLIDTCSRENLIEIRLTRWPRAIPLYSPELEALVPILKQDQSGIVLFGNYLGELGLASILETTRDLRRRVEKL